MSAPEGEQDVTPPADEPAAPPQSDMSAPEGEQDVTPPADEPAAPPQSDMSAPEGEQDVTPPEEQTPPSDQTTPVPGAEQEATPPADQPTAPRAETEPMPQAEQPMEQSEPTEQAQAPMEGETPSETGEAPSDQVEEPAATVFNAADVDTEINFPIGSAKVDESGAEQLGRVAEALEANPDVKIEVSGYTDGTGSPQLNEKLSQKRAENVKQMLIDKGVNADRIEAKGFGEMDKVDDTPGPAEANRRVAVRAISGTSSDEG
jgi:outer membrane protein OmpA-like peptidoglycan-associated protein